MVGLSQAVSIRCGGFHVVNIANLAAAVQVLYVAMMYDIYSLPNFSLNTDPLQPEDI